ncbi:NAD-dependent epimerase/dehydratase family protein [Halogranum rubrum]|nr:NAD(P)-dependent oxidoreductase [Halogranum rubrum]
MTAVRRRRRDAVARFRGFKWLFAVRTGVMSECTSVVVTGALGGAGQWTVDGLLADGYDVVGLDQRLPADGGPDDADFFQVDLTDRGETAELLSTFEPDAVVHLAAIPDPTNHAGSRVFANNVLSTYNVLDAAGRAGARVVQASSESAYGFPFAQNLLVPDYLPIDESHPLRPEDPYGVSKVTGEALAGMTTRRYGVPVASIRPSWVQYPGAYQATTNREAFDLDELAALPAGRSPSGGAGNFWSYIDVRDFVSMVSAALTADVSGHEAYLCHAAENYLGVATSDLIDALYDDAPPCPVTGDDSAFTTVKAERELGWAPEHTWREAADADVAGPNFG